MLSIIVLAGGKAKRFQRKMEPWVDKLLYKVEGESIIRRVLKAALDISDDVIISTDSKQRGITYANEVKDIGDVKISVDITELGCDGPLLGIASSMDHVKGDYVGVIAGDLPFITSDVIRNLINYADMADVITPYWGNGSVESLIFIAKRSRLELYSKFLCIHGFWRSSGIQRISLKTLYVPANVLTDDAKVFLDVNYRDDLNREIIVPKIAEKELLITFDSDLEMGHDEAFSTGHFFLAAIKLFRERSLDLKLRSIKAFEQEARFYMRQGLRIFASQAMFDASKVLNMLGFSSLARSYYRKAFEISKT